MFPPDKIAPTFLPANRLSLRMAASTVAPDNSTTIFMRSKRIFEASII